MKISTKGSYGIRAMVDLAVHYTGEHVPLGSIAERQDISANYLEQVFSILRKAGFVKSVKGAQGGYHLGRKAEDITAGMILRTLEGDLSVIDEAKEAKSPHNSIQYYLKDNLWNKINRSVEEVVDSITLEDLANGYKEQFNETEVMYYI
ncbi:RrF2 family transcriptional regulator [Alkalibacter mobilis]|uniref:RrF2 family transcriptional regulator n=1 Tax=Alkalibacter mobilis TaxID=2787712 RepID=UPI00189F4DF7|nr:Rrf2 family transcriptional regulator [Alkalibacter mobilis]